MTQRIKPLTATSFKTIIILLVVFKLAFLVVTPKASCETIYVNETGWVKGGIFHPSSTPISSAVANASNGDEIVIRDGIYHDNVNVDISVTIHSENGSSRCFVYAANKNGNVFSLSSSNSSVIGLSIVGANNKAGIRIEYAENCTIRDNVIWGCNDGIYIRGPKSKPSKCNRIINNTIYNNEIGIKLSGKGCKISNISNNEIYNCNEGLTLIHANMNIIQRNDIYNNTCGICLKNADENKITHNYIHENKFGINLTKSNDNSENNSIAYNNILNNTWNIYNNQNIIAIVKNNYWGLLTNESIDSKIYDDDENSSIGKIVFYPFLTNSAPIQEVRTVLLLVIGLSLLTIAKRM